MSGITERECCIVGATIHWLIENPEALSRFQAQGEYSSAALARQAVVRLMAKTPFRPPLDLVATSSDSAGLSPSTGVSCKLAAFLLDEAQDAVKELQESSPLINLEQILARLSSVDSAICQVNPEQKSIKPIIEATARRQARLKDLYTTLIHGSTPPDRVYDLKIRYLKDTHNTATEDLTNLAVSWLAQVACSFEMLSLRWKLVRNVESSEEVLQSINPS
ncbi:hypothetical protein KCU93_g7514, partial [Aureobasidium melanogenum]